MTQDLKAQIVSLFERIAEKPFPMEDIALTLSYIARIAEEGLEILADPNAFVGRWETDMSKAPRDGSDVLAVGVTDDGRLTAPAIIYFELYEDRGWLCARTQTQASTQPCFWTHLPPAPKKGGGNNYCVP